MIEKGEICSSGQTLPCWHIWGTCLQDRTVLILANRAHGRGLRRAWSSQREAAGQAGTYLLGRSSACTAPPHRHASCPTAWRASRTQSGGCCDAFRNLSSAPLFPFPRRMAWHRSPGCRHIWGPNPWGLPVWTHYDERVVSPKGLLEERQEALSPLSQHPGALSLCPWGQMGNHVTAEKVTAWTLVRSPDSGGGRIGASSPAAEALRNVSTCLWPVI